MKPTRECDPLERMARALMILDGLTYHQDAMMKQGPLTHEEQFVHDVYSIAHAAHGHCGNPHCDWLDLVDERAKELEVTNTLTKLEENVLEKFREQLFDAIQGVNPMGVFDSVTIEYELEPGLPELKGDWQTKSLDCTMSSFVLTADGRLLQKVPKVEIKDGEPVETEETKTIDRNYEGTFTVYHSLDKEWFQFDITMIDGDVKLVRREKARCMGWQ
jgi:hypothetical protein